VVNGGPKVNLQLVLIEGDTLTAELDSGTSQHIVGKEEADRLWGEDEGYKDYHGPPLLAANGTPIEVVGVKRAMIMWGDLWTPFDLVVCIGVSRALVSYTALAMMGPAGDPTPNSWEMRRTETGALQTHLCLGGVVFVPETAGSNVYCQSNIDCELLHAVGEEAVEPNEGLDPTFTVDRVSSEPEKSKAPDSDDEDQQDHWGEVPWDAATPWDTADDREIAR
jgi:hypothetical protein